MPQVCGREGAGAAAGQRMVAALVQRHAPEVAAVRARVDAEPSSLRLQVGLAGALELGDPLVEELERPPSIGEVCRPTCDHGDHRDRGGDPGYELDAPPAQVEPRLHATEKDRGERH
jgi:hypothetical protein